MNTSFRFIAFVMGMLVVGLVAMLGLGWLLAALSMYHHMQTEFWRDLQYAAMEIECNTNRCNSVLVAMTRTDLHVKSTRSAVSELCSQYRHSRVAIGYSFFCSMDEHGHPFLFHVLEGFFECRWYILYAMLVMMISAVVVGSGMYLHQMIHREVYRDIPASDFASQVFGHTAEMSASPEPGTLRAMAEGWGLTTRKKKAHVL